MAVKYGYVRIKGQLYASCKLAAAKDYIPTAHFINKVLADFVRETLPKPKVLSKAEEADARKAELDTYNIRLRAAREGYKHNMEMLNGAKDAYDKLPPGHRNIPTLEREIPKFEIIMEASRIELEEASKSLWPEQDKRFGIAPIDPYGFLKEEEEHKRKPTAPRSAPMDPFDPAELLAELEGRVYKPAETTTIEERGYLTMEELRAELAAWPDDEG